MNPFANVDIRKIYYVKAHTKIQVFENKEWEKLWKNWFIIISCKLSHY